jgi:hypothetical protein
VESEGEERGYADRQRGKFVLKKLVINDYRDFIKNIHQ